MLKRPACFKHAGLLFFILFFRIFLSCFILCGQVGIDEAEYYQRRNENDKNPVENHSSSSLSKNNGNSEKLNGILT